MTKHDDPDDPERKKREDDETLPLFAKPPEKPKLPPTGKAMELGMEALARTSRRERNVRLTEKLIPLALRLASERPTVTADDLRLLGCAEGILDADDPTYDFLGSVMKKAGLVNTGQITRSKINRSHGRHLVIWKAPSLNGK